MSDSKKESIEEYISSLPTDKHETINQMRALIIAALPSGYEEQIRWGMLSYEVPLDIYPNTYNRQPLLYAALAANKSYYSLYLMSIYQDANLFNRIREAFTSVGNKMNMGKSCLRFKQTADLPLEAIKQVIAAVPLDEFIARYEQITANRKMNGRN